MAAALTRFIPPVTTDVFPASMALYPACATSSAVITCATRNRRVVSMSARVENSVRVGPGHSTVDVTPVPASSTDSASERLSTYALLA